jgi:hypothetical protein
MVWHMAKDVLKHKAAKLSQAFVLRSSGLSCSRKNFWQGEVRLPILCVLPWSDSFVKLTTYQSLEAWSGWELCLGSLGAQDRQRTICYSGLEIAQKYCLSSENLEVGETLNSAYS